ncbi:hypothetical protein CWB81_17770 [Pseudoalteromonas sp. S1688]|nr:hypothetical protein CWB81_17770 [Pseudoalteromonas sp. S1688]
MVIVFSFTSLCAKDLKEILFTTEGAEHTEEMIKDMFYLFCLLCEARSASVYSVVQKIKTLFTTEVTEFTEEEIKDKDFRF